MCGISFQSGAVHREKVSPTDKVDLVKHQKPLCLLSRIRCLEPVFCGCKFFGAETDIFVIIETCMLAFES